MQCRAIDCRSHAQCERQAVHGEQFCSSHKRARLPRKPSLPPDQRTSALDVVGEIIACRESAKPKPRRVTRAEYEADPENYVVIAKGTIHESIALRCRAKAKQSGERCKQAVSPGKKVCHYHGGASTGPKDTTNCGKHFLVHGRETQAIRRHRKQKNAEFRVLQRVIREHGL